MRSTPGFTLQHLQFLVVDEADRLLRQAYQARCCSDGTADAMLKLIAAHLQDWLPSVLAATAPVSVEASVWGMQAAPLLPMPLQLEISERRRFRGGAQGDRVATPRLVKLVVSATLTRDPSKIGRLELFSPLLLTAGAKDQRCAALAVVLRRGRPTHAPLRYRLAPQLRQWRVVIGAEEKPLALLALLQKLAGQLVMVFAGSVRLSVRQLSGVPHLRQTAQVDATRRLYSMLSALDADFPVSCVEYSSLQSHTERSHALELFRRREATVLVASDAATRGLDVEVRPC